MADDGIDGRPYLDTVSVPGVVVMPGDPWPAAFYARYPEAFRLPVRITWRDGPAKEGAVPQRPSSSTPQTRQIADVADAAAEDTPNDNTASIVPATAVPLGVRDGGEAADTFLRINDSLNRLRGSAAPETFGSRQSKDRIQNSD
jgi:hypothetical protein